MPQTFTLEEFKLISSQLLNKKDMSSEYKTACAKVLIDMGIEYDGTKTHNEICEIAEAELLKFK